MFIVWEWELPINLFECQSIRILTPFFKIQPIETLKSCGLIFVFSFQLAVSKVPEISSSFACILLFAYKVEWSIIIFYDF